MVIKVRRVDVKLKHLKAHIPKFLGLTALFSDTKFYQRSSIEVIVKFSHHNCLLYTYKQVLGGILPNTCLILMFLMLLTTLLFYIALRYIIDGLNRQII